MITFSEFPDEIALCINITNCPFHCPGCHSPELWEDIGTELTKEELSKLIESNKGITLVGFMGGNLKEVNPLAEYVKNINPL
jgi:anaerobic ribonucleoside-triphosphate reductase activating protein